MNNVVRCKRDRWYTKSFDYIQLCWKDTEPGQGLFTLTKMAQHMETFTLEAKEARLLKCGKIVCWHPSPGELAPPPRRNPGSATGYTAHSELVYFTSIYDEFDFCMKGSNRVKPIEFFPVALIQRYHSNPC